MVKVGLHASNKASFQNDRVQLHRVRVNIRKSAVRISNGGNCNICRLQLSRKGRQYRNLKVSLFVCGHAYHLNCLQVAMPELKLATGSKLVCYACNSQHMVDELDQDKNDDSMNMAPMRISTKEMHAARLQLNPS